MAVRIKDLTTTATEAASDDYVAIDGATNGTRKILASDFGGEKMIDFESSLTPSIDARGVSFGIYSVTPANAADMTFDSLRKVKAYLYGSSEVYPLLVVRIYKYTSTFSIYVKSIYDSVQNTSSSTISGTLHLVAPFAITSATTSM